MIIISPDDAVAHSFYGLKIGDKKSDVSGPCDQPLR